MRLALDDPLKVSEARNASECRLTIYELQIDGRFWGSLVSQFESNGFTNIPDGIVTLNEETGMIRLRLASIIEGE